MADKWSNWQATDLFGSAIPQLLPKWDSGQMAQPVALPVGFGTGVGIAGGIVGTAAGNNLLSGALDAAKLPGDVYQGNVDLNSPAGFARAQNMAGMLIGGGMPMAEAGALGMAGGKLAKPELPYPIAPRSEWYGDANYKVTGGKLQTMTPDEFLTQSRPMKIEETARENIDDLKRHILEGNTLDPLALYKNGKEDGRHRAHAAKELGIPTVPVLNWRD